MGPVQLQFIIWAVSLCFSGMILRDKLELMHDNRVKWHGHVAVQRAHHVSNHNHNFSRLRLLRTVKLKVSGVSRSNAPIWFYLPISHPFFLVVLARWCVQEQASASARFCRCVKGKFKFRCMQCGAVQIVPNECLQ